MKKMIVCCLSLVAFYFSHGQTLQVCSFNIRLDVASDSPNHWQARKEKLVSQVLFHQTDLLGVQEALPNQ
jgi:endonuclease/exonuclease/phosphatase family metal-dependent hydrolase